MVSTHMYIKISAQVWTEITMSTSEKNYSYLCSTIMQAIECLQMFCDIITLSQCDQ